MKGLFLQILNMSVSASWLILAVFLLRVILSKANVPKSMHYILWAFVAVRLLCPLSIESAFSFMPSTEFFSTGILYGDNPEINSGIPMVDEVVNAVLSEQFLQAEHVGAFQMGTSVNVGETGNSTLGGNNMNTTSGNDDATQNPQNGTSDGNQAQNMGEDNVNSDVSSFADNNTSDNGDFIYGAGETERNPVQNLLHIASIIWGLGVAGMLVYTFASYIRLRRTVGASIHLREDLWICDEIGSPFILGLRQPRIYIPSHISEEQIPYIVAHEREHLKYHDNLWKPIGFGILSLHWFNPLVWLAYTLMCKDLELACDERVIRNMDNVEKKKYTESLLLCSNPRHLISACPVAFGEVGIKERILRVISYKKPAVWAVVIGVLLCIIVAIGFLTKPVNEDEGYTEYVIHETKAYVTRDENKDLIQTVLYSKDGNKDYENQDNYIRIKVFHGDERGMYEDEPVYVSRKYNSSEAENGTLGITTIDGMDYFFGTDVVENEDEVTYTYSIYYINKGKIEVVDKKIAQFVRFNGKLENSTGPFWHEVVPQFQADLQAWLGGTTLLVSYDEKIMISDAHASLWANHYYDTLWTRHEEYDYNEEEIENPYSHAMGGSWQGFIRDIEGAGERDIAWFNNELESDFSEWFAEFQGQEGLHHIGGHKHGCDGNCSVSACCDTVYYEAKQGEDIQDVLYKLVEAMIAPRMIASLDRTYTITAYELMEQDLVEVSEHMWILPHLEGYYAFDGVDVRAMEEGYPKKDDLVHFQSKVTDSGLWYVIIEENGVYRMQTYRNMLLEKAECVGSLVDIPEGKDNYGIGNVQCWGYRPWDEIVALYPDYPDVQKIERDFNSEQADISKWFEDYNGAGLQIISNPEEAHCGIPYRREIVYYRTNETDIQTVIHEMLTAMIDPLMEDEEGRYYTVVRYELDEEQSLVPINENVWILNHISGYYEYEGVDMVTFEHALEYETDTKDGMIRFLAEGSNGVFQYMLLREGNVYRLEIASEMGYGIEY